MYGVPKFLKRDGESLLFNQEGEFVFYVPEEQFTKNIAVIDGSYVHLLGLLNYAIFDTKGNHNGLRTFKFPTVFTCRPYIIEKIKGVKLTQHTKEKDYRVLKFKKGDQVVTSVKVAQDVENAEKFYKLFLTGDLPTTIPYDKLHEYFIENIRLNGADYGMNIQLFGILVSEMCRSSNDIYKLFRNTNIKNMTDYDYISVKEIPKYVSPFTSITSENWDEAVINSVINKNEVYSPLEKLFTL